MRGPGAGSSCIHPMDEYLYLSHESRIIIVVSQSLQSIQHLLLAEEEWGTVWKAGIPGLIISTFRCIMYGRRVGLGILAVIGGGT